MNIFIDNKSGAPIYEQIFTQLKSQIISGTLPSDEALPSIRSLAKDLRISVVTTKRAYDELEKEGFIYTIAAKGCFVAPLNTDLLRETNLKKIDSFDSLGHLDYVVRYGAHQAEAYSYRKYAEEIDEILKHLISHGKGLEMNMAGMKYGLGFPNPHPDVIRRYKELGGEIVTIGADAHRPEHVAFDYEQAGEILISCGFSYYAEFKGRKPVFRRIVP